MGKTGRWEKIHNKGIILSNCYENFTHLTSRKYRKIYINQVKII